MGNKFLLNRIATQLIRIANSLEKKNMSNDEEIAQIKSSISGFANEASENELSALLEIAAFANTEYNQKLFSHVNNQ